MLAHSFMRALWTRVDVHRSPALFVGLSKGHLQLPTPLLVKGQGLMQRQLREQLCANSRTGVQRQLDQSRTRQQHDTHGCVVGQPTVRGER
jgi:hypothetical protein